MGPSSATGRGKPRPLLAGVYRKACDYCVRSKRGCNGGTPCEQCIRRGQDCTYSQRRKSGPRGRPLRQQQVISAASSGTPPLVGTRTSSRRRTKRTPSFHDDDDEEEEEEEEEDRTSGQPSATSFSPGSSPSRTASLSSSASLALSTSSDEAETDNDSDTVEQEGAGGEEEERQQPQNDEHEQRKKKKQPEEHLQRQVHKRSKIARPEAGAAGEVVSANEKPSPVLFPRGGDGMPPCSLLANKARTRGGAMKAKEAEKNVVLGGELIPTVPPSLSSLSSSSSCSSSSSSSGSYCGSADEGASCTSKDNVTMAVVDTPNSNKHQVSPPRQQSAMTIGVPPVSLHLERSSSLPTWARDASPDTKQQQEQQEQEQQRLIASVGAAPSTSGSSDGSNSKIHEVFSQPSEIPSSPSSSSSLPPSPLDLPRSVTLVHTSQQRQRLHQQAQAHQAPAFAVKCSSSNSSNSSVVLASNDSSQPSLPRARDSMDVALPQQQQQQQQHATTLAAASMMLDDGGSFGAGGLREWQEDDDLECCPWQIPSLTREMSLARVVAGLGGEQSTLLSQGVGFEGSFVGW